MLAVALIKLLVISIAMLGLIRIVVIALIGDTQNDLAIWRFDPNRPTGAEPECRGGLSEMKRLSDNLLEAD